jgi:hypothetical protein
MQHVLGSLDNNPLLMDALIKKQVGIDCLPFMGMDSKFSLIYRFSNQSRIWNNDLRSFRNQHVYARLELPISPCDFRQACRL